MAHTFSITVSDVEYKAFQLRVSDPDAWAGHALRNKIRKAAIWVAEEHAKDPSAFLTPADRTAIKAVMDANGDFMKRPREWSNATLVEIVNRTTMPTKAERDLLDDELP
jgi:hypothetical protein